MKKSVKLALILTTALCLSSSGAKAENPGSLQEEFNNQAKQYEQLFKDGKAEALADLWTADGSLETGDGAVYRGRKAIREYFEKSFKHLGTQQLSVHITNLQEPSKGVVLEEGTTAVRDLPPDSKYTVLHVKGDDGWKMAWVTETTLVKDNVETIKDIEWLTGSWKSANKDGNVSLDVKPIEGGHFLDLSTINPGPNGNSRQIIGYNPMVGTLVSWHFGAKGGFGRGIWKKTANGWRQECFSVMQNGLTSNAVYTLRVRSKDCISIQSTERFVGGVSIPDSAVTVLNRVSN